MNYFAFSKSIENCLYKMLLFSMLFLFFSRQSPAAPITQPDTNHLKVGLAGSPPFVMSGAENKSGIAFEIWDAVADAAKWHYSIQKYPTVADALTAMQEGKLDLVVGPISITSDRIKEMDFSQPYYYSGLSIMSRKDDPSIIDRISPIFSKRFVAVVLVFLFILSIVGTLFWLAEREKSPHEFPHDFLHGIANGMWLAIVTMTTVGYGDRAPITFWGRVIAGSWMVISIIFATSMVAGIASTLTLTGMGSNTITEASQLNGKLVATPSFQAAGNFLEEAHAKVIRTSNLEESYKLLKEKKVAAIVFDRPQLLYFQRTNPDDDIIVSRSEYDPTGYGFAFPLKCSLKKKINFQMLNLNELGHVNHIIKSWIDDKNRE